MMADKKAPILVKPIPDIALHARDTLNVDLSRYIQNISDDHGEIHFAMTLSDGEPLPGSLHCSPEGLLTGVASDHDARSEAYALLIVAKNSAPVPLIASCHLVISEALVQEDSSANNPQDVSGDIFGEESAQALDLSAREEEPVDLVSTITAEGDEYTENDPEYEALLQDFLGDLDADAADMMEEIKSVGASRGMTEKALQEIYIEYMLRRYASIQLYNADYEGEGEVDAMKITDSAVGWKIYIDGDFALSTTNPDPYGAYVNRGFFVDTVREMVGLAVEKGWKTVGVAGFDKQVGLRLVHQHNHIEQLKHPNDQCLLKFDELFQDQNEVQAAIKHAVSNVTARND